MFVVPRADSMVSSIDERSGMFRRWTIPSAIHFAPPEPEEISCLRRSINIWSLRDCTEVIVNDK